jgi:hypothetical protein
VTTFPYEEDDMISTGDEIRPLLAAAVSDEPPTTDLLSGVRRAQHRRRVLVPVASVTTAGALGVAAVTVLGVGGAPSAQATVTAAAAHTSDQSFRVRMVGNRGIYNGAFDPAHRTGRLTFPDGGEDRYVGDTLYMRNAGAKAISLPPGKRWISVPRMTNAEMAEIGPAIEVVKLGAQDPQFALRQLRSATHVRDAGSTSGAGWTGHRYSFTVTSAPDAKKVAMTATGTVTVDSNGLVRVLDITATGAGSPTHSVMEFSDYGVKVDVTAPPADQVFRSKTDRMPAGKKEYKLERKPAASPSPRP